MTFAPGHNARRAGLKAARSGARALLVAGVLSAPLALTADSALAAKNNRRSSGIEPWPGRRVLLLMPLTLGPGFNADQNFGRAILPQAEAELFNQLQKTGKFSVVRAHRFSPLLQRGLQEKRLTEAQVADAIKEPAVPGAAAALLSQFTFEQTPMIAEFALEEVRGGGTATRPSVQAQVSGRLYELNNPVAIKSPVITSVAVEKGRNNIERYLSAATDGFRQVAAEFVAPIEDFQLPRVEPLPAPAPVTTIVQPETPTPPATPAVPLNNPDTTIPGDVSITGSSSRIPEGGVPQLPSARPPLGITVPNSPSPR